MTSTYPSAVLCNVIADPSVPVETLLHAVLDILAERDGFAPLSWTCLAEAVATSTDQAERPGLPPRDAVAQFGEAAFAQGFAIDGKADDGLIVKPLSGDPDAEAVTMREIHEGWWLFDRLWVDSTATDAGFVQGVGQLCQMVRKLAQQMPLLGAEVRRQTESYLGPIPPHADPDLVMACVQTDDISRDYADPDAYWESWDEVQYIGNGLALVTRGEGIADETEFKERVMNAAFTMGRAALPGLTQYYQAEPSKEEAAMLQAFPRYLQQVGYDAAAKTLEFTALVPEDDRLTPADIFTVLDFQCNGTASGGEVDEVIVTFPSRSMAEQEAAPLRDIGDVRIQYLQPDGSWAALEN
ncbi:hypothetical protein KUW17_21590 [Leisingera aquaemixtae]|uniref:hypothetical protein n=1 Tax=Leisingera TaxID=191028 RepID=UPI001C987BC8|nr:MULTISPECIES: hypothetical protein [Leisingera]MBY6069351.1 hypothetical protein [Leisingera aquaemixtae]MCB4457334.1 hypothetical protein [Leisingera sp. McT4-56]